MPLKMSPEDRKAAIRAELVRRAEGGEIITYAGLGLAIDGPARGPWKRVLDAIRSEELDAHRPDLTSVVVSGATKYPSYISKDHNSRKVSMDERQKVFAFYQVNK